MARVYKGSNHLHRSVWRNRWGGMLSIILGVGYSYLLWQSDPGFSYWHAWPAVVLGILANYLFGRAGKYRGGLTGEKICLKYAKKLPDTYFVFTNVVFRGLAGRTEIDLVIVGETGVFVLEIKNHRGTICGDANKPEWKQHVGRGRTYIRPLYNPLRQAKRQAYNLAEALRHQAIGVWVESVVVFANKAAKVEVMHGRHPILRSPKEICSFILENHCAQPLEETMVAKIAHAVRRLQQKG